MCLDATRIDTGMVTEILQVVHGEMREPHKRSFGRSPGFIKACCLRAAKDFGIANVEAVHKGGLPTEAIRAATQTDAMTVRCLDAAPFSAAFIDRVDKVSSGAALETRSSSEMSRIRSDVRRRWPVPAIEARVIESGRRKSQRDGVVLAPRRRGMSKPHSELRPARVRETRLSVSRIFSIVGSGTALIRSVDDVLGRSAFGLVDLKLPARSPGSLGNARPRSTAVLEPKRRRWPASTVPGKRDSPERACRSRARSTREKRARPAPRSAVPVQTLVRR